MKYCGYKWKMELGVFIYSLSSLVTLFLCFVFSSLIFFMTEGCRLGENVPFAAIVRQRFVPVIADIGFNF